VRREATGADDLVIAASDSPGPAGTVRDTIRYWELGRLWYNVALTTQVGAWVILTWPHFRPAFSLASLGKLLVLAAIANVLYSTVYLVDGATQAATASPAWRERRWILWVVGTLFALLIECYWIGDEIYPYVTGG
jgi:hypothetical protein